MTASIHDTDSRFEITSDDTASDTDAGGRPVAMRSSSRVGSVKSMTTITIKRSSAVLFRIPFMAVFLLKWFRLKLADFFEGEVAAFGCDDDVINERYPHKQAGRCQSLGQLHVVRAGRRVTRGMVVANYNT
jgi:hypothetical protein